VESKRDKFGTNYRPVLSIVGWAKWPAPNGNGGAVQRPAARPPLHAALRESPTPPPASPDDYGTAAPVFDDDIPF
jgi:hypothetical protein